MIAVRELPTENTPQYRAHHHGYPALSNAELLQLITSFEFMETSQELLAQAGNLSKLATMSESEMVEIDNIGPAAAKAIKAAIELGRRAFVESQTATVTVRSPSDVAVIFQGRLQNLEQEHFDVMLLNTRNQVLKTYTLYIGSLNASHIRVAEVFKEAIRENAAAIIVAHNHPSGNPSPSPEDVNVTKQIREAGKMLGIDLMDHLVIGRSNFVSLRDRGLGFN
jgi:DNA repair protein RadC